MAVVQGTLTLKSQFFHSMSRACLSLPAAIAALTTSYTVDLQTSLVFMYIARSRGHRLYTYNIRSYDRDVGVFPSCSASSAHPVCACTLSSLDSWGGMAISKGEGVQVSQRGDQRHGRSLFPSHLISLSLPFSFQSTLSPFLLSYSALFSISLAFLPLPTLPIFLLSLPSPAFSAPSLPHRTYRWHWKTSRR